MSPSSVVLDHPGNGITAMTTMAAPEKKITRKRKTTKKAE